MGSTLLFYNFFVGHKPQQGGLDLIMHAEWFATLVGPFVNLKNVCQVSASPYFQHGFCLLQTGWTLCTGKANIWYFRAGTDAMLL